MNSTERLDDRDWSRLTLGERIRQIEVEGYLVLPDLLTADEVAALKAETARFDTFAVDYSVHQQVRPNVQFRGGKVTDGGRTRLSLVTHYSSARGYPEDRRAPGRRPRIEELNGGRVYADPTLPDDENRFPR